LPLRRKHIGRTMEDYAFLCIYVPRRNALNSACERVAAVANHAQIRRSNASVAGRYGNGTLPRIRRLGRAMCLSPKAADVGAVVRRVAGSRPPVAAVRDLGAGVSGEGLPSG
jgi:hypothetical protein